VAVGRATNRVTAGTLLGVAALHLAWAGGSSFPFHDREDLADSVVGTQTVPRPAACYAVAGALAAASAIVAGLPAGRPAIRRLGVLGVVAILGVRGVLGLARRTNLVSPGSTSPRFRQLDRRFYSPLCLTLALGAWSARRPTDS
jgi:Protein of unknown function (DUF3995)